MSKQLAVLAVLVVCLQDCCGGGRNEKLIWREEFDRLDETVWNHLVTGWRGGNREFEYYRNNRKNSYVRKGILYLKPTLTAEDYGEEFLYNGFIDDPECNQEPCISASGADIVLPIQSARIRTLGSFGFLYGRVEVRAEMPRGDWIWPAIWMKPVQNAYGSWPASGEIDVIELRGNRKLTDGLGVSQGVEKMGSTVHFGPNASYNVWRPTHWQKALTDEDFSDNFHVYGLEWTEESLTFTVDGEFLGSVTPPEGGFWKLGGFDKNPGGTNIWENGTALAPFDKAFFFILNVAVGGTFFPDGWRNLPYPKPWNWSSPHPLKDFWEHKKWWLPTWNDEDVAMKVDYIRVYSLQ